MPRVDDVAVSSEAGQADPEQPHHPEGAAPAEPSAPPEEPAAAEPSTRSERHGLRVRRAPALSAKDLSTTLLMVRVLAVAALAGLFVLTAWAHPLALAAAHVWACAGLAWGWPGILRVAAGLRLFATVTLTGLLVAVGVSVSEGEVLLGLAPIALAAGVVLTFLLQLVRSDGRAGLTDEVVATTGALAFVGLGAGLVPLGRTEVGQVALTVAMVGVAVSLVADAVSAKFGPSPWSLLLTFALGGLAGGVVGGLLGLPIWWHGVVVGAVSALLSYAVRRLVEVLPGSLTLAGQLASACASVLAVGALAQVLARVVVGV